MLQHESASILVSLSPVSMLHFCLAQICVNDPHGFGEFNYWPWNYSFNHLIPHVIGLRGWCSTTTGLVCLLIWIIKHLATQTRNQSGYCAQYSSTIDISWNKKASSEKLKTVSHPILPIFFLFRNGALSNSHTQIDSLSSIAFWIKKLDKWGLFLYVHLLFV